MKTNRTVCYFKLSAENSLTAFLTRLEKALARSLGKGKDELPFPSLARDRLTHLAGAFAPLIGPLLGMKLTPVVILDGVEHIEEADELEALRTMVWSWTEVQFVLGGTRLPNAPLRTRDCPLGKEVLQIFGDAREKIARAIHKFYLEKANAPEWDDFDDKDKRKASNFHQADFIPSQLSSLGLFMKPLVEGEERVEEFKEEQVEFLAVREHLRWLREKRLLGYAPTDDRDARNDNPDNGPLLHPALKPWDQLDPDYKENCRRAVRAIPEILVMVGLAIGRHPNVLVARDGRSPTSRRAR
jgi:hypothetical protein